MTDTNPVFSPLRNLLENAARCGDTACVSAQNEKAALQIAHESRLDVKIYLIPKLKSSPHPDS